MLFVDVQCFIVHITGQFFEYECLGVINAIHELQFTNQGWKNYLKLLQSNGTWPSTELLNSPKGPIDLHGVYGCRVTTCNEIYDDGVKVGATISVPHW